MSASHLQGLVTFRRGLLLHPLSNLVGQAQEGGIVLAILAVVGEQVHAGVKVTLVERDELSKPDLVVVSIPHRHHDRPQLRRGGVVPQDELPVPLKRGRHHVPPWIGFSVHPGSGLRRCPASR